MNIIQCYAATNDTDDQIKDDNNNQLQSAIQSYTEREITMLIWESSKLKLATTTQAHPEEEEKTMGHE